MRFIGITGGVGSGKTELLHYIKDHYSCEICLADEVAHEVMRPGTQCYQALLEVLGKDVWGEDGQIRKAVMAERIFADRGVLARVNAIVHPAVRDELMGRLARARERGDVDFFFVEAALLIEAGYRQAVDELWYVYADERMRTERLAAARGYSTEKIRGIMGSQLSDEAFRKECDFVIDNSGSLEDSYRQIDIRLK